MSVRAIFARKAEKLTAKRKRMGGRDRERKRKGKERGCAPRMEGPGLMRTSGQRIDVFLTTLSIINQIWSP